MENDTEQQGNTNFSSTQPSGSNARRISSTFKKNLGVKPRAITGTIDERDPNVLNLQEQQKRGGEETPEQNEPDIYDEKIEEKNNKTAQRINEEKLREFGPDNEVEAIAAAEQVYGDAGLPTNEQLIATLKQKNDFKSVDIPEPQFPYIMITFAIMKDVFDVFLTLGSETIVLLVVAEIFSTIFGIVIFTWLFSKSQTGNRKVFKKQVRGAIATLLVEEIPLVQAFPTETLYIWWTYHKEKQEVKKQKKALQKLKDLNIIRK